MLLSIIVGLCLVLLVAAAMQYSTKFNYLVIVFNQASIFVMILLFGLIMIGNALLSYIKR